MVFSLSLATLPVQEVDRFFRKLNLQIVEPEIGPAGGQRYIRKGNMVICEVVDLDAWMKEGKRRFAAETVEE